MPSDSLLLSLLHLDIDRLLDLWQFLNVTLYLIENLSFLLEHLWPLNVIPLQ